ncbi:sensor histidine kinase [Arsenicibacter rosenii]|uniref:histidine kinase n=1 Tax=Arsenicibacter rosenii TaxID=1750698 RepID=A0A1S2VC64_9BACT|nr:HAMP domain-containing sensor histidine kinase [Arsenicibacter rosenii]OIN55905.1 hypothetical protein BLX24_27530 [Arsenicibacter rosenii]
MTLLRKTLLYLLLVMLPVALGGGWLFDTLIRRGIYYEIDEQLSSDLAYIQQQLIRQQVTVGQDHHLLDNPHIEPVAGPGQLTPVYSDTTEFDWREHNPVPVRQLKAILTVGDKHYLVVVKQAMGEFDEIARLLSISVVGGFMLLLGLLVVLNSWVSKRLWTPFFTLIEQLRTFRLDASEPVRFSGSSIAEFDHLSATLNDMSQNLQQQYQLQKAFTEHAAHELQTPLAVITTQLDQLLGTEPLTGEQVALMESAQHSVRRLVHLNKSLLLLTKVENQQFAGLQTVDLSSLAAQQCRQFALYAAHRGLDWQVSIAAGVTRRLNPYLADVMFSNLLKNAMLHATANTNVYITLTASSFTIRNTGEPLPFPEDQLFSRFVKHPARPDSTGLGLAITREIARRYDIALNYRYHNDIQEHVFMLDFQTSQ